VLEQSGDVTRDEIFSIAKPNDRRRTQAGGNNLLRVIRREKNQSVNAAQFLQGAADGLLKWNAALRVFFDKVRDNLRVGFGNEFVAFLLEPFLELEIFSMIPLWNDDDLAGQSR